MFYNTFGKNSYKCKYKVDRYYRRYWYFPETVTVIKSHNFQSVCAFPIPYTSAEIKSDDSHSPIT